MEQQIAMVEVFKTNVQQDADADHLLALLLCNFPNCRINFDLDDCDKVLRLEGDDIDACRIMELLDEAGFCCEILTW